MTLNCKEVNIVWIERGLLVILTYIILKNYQNLKTKKIFLSNKNLNIFFSYIFSDLQFVTSIGDIIPKNIFYFNIRKNIKNSGIIVDYLSNYDTYIPTDKIWLVPYYDMNDPLILYHYDSKKKIDPNDYTDYFKKFSTCNRGNYLNKGIIWDVMFENSVIEKAKNFGINNLYFIINNFVKNKYTSTTEKVYYPLMGLDEAFYGKPKPPKSITIITNNNDKKIIQNERTQHEEKLIKLINIMNEKIKKINKYIE